MNDADFFESSDSSMTEKKKRPFSKENLTRLAGIYKFTLPYHRQFTIGIFSLLLSSVILLSFPLLSGQLIDVASGKSSWISNDLQTIALCLLGVFFIQSIFSFTRVYYFAQVNEKAVATRKESNCLVAKGRG